MSEVLKPWTPITAQETETGITASVWGREYIFGHGIFPEQIVTGGKPLLKEPIRVVGIEKAGVNVV